MSIVTPSRNQGRYIGRTIRSVLGQDYPRIEYILIDGGSTDETVDEIRRHAGRIAYWVSEPDAGQADALCKGLARAAGEIIGWLNSDDQYYGPDIVRRAAQLFARRPDVDFCYGANVYVDEDDRVLYLRSAVPFFSRSLLRAWNFLHQPTIFFRRRVLERIEFNAGLHYVMDYEFWLRAAWRFRFARLPGIVAASRWHRGCKTMTDVKASYDELEQVQGQLGKPWLARVIPPRHTARVLYNLQRVLSIAQLRQLWRWPRFDHIRVEGLEPLLRCQLLGLRLGGSPGRVKAGARAGA